MPRRCRPLTPWGKEVKKQMLEQDIEASQIISALRAQGIRTSASQISCMLSGTLGQRSPEVVAAIDRLLSIPEDIPGRPA